MTRLAHRVLPVLVAIASVGVTSVGCRRSIERISPDADAGATNVPSSAAPEQASSPLDEALKLGPIDLIGDEAASFWEGIDVAWRQDRWVEATLVRRIPGGYVSRLQGPFAPGRSVEHEVNGWLPSSDELDAFLGSRVMCKVRSFDARRGAVVLAGDGAHERVRREVLSRLEPGAKLSGRVTAVADYGALVALDDVPDDLWLSTAMMHVTAFGRNGAPKPGERVMVTPEKAWMPSLDGHLFFVTRL